jgi:hypothetical protein
VKIYFTANMPKTAIGKVQRRLVAKAMIERAGGHQGKTKGLLPGVTKKVNGLNILNLFPRWIVAFVLSLLFWRQLSGRETGI